MMSDTALVLPTSGTTGAPKLVPLTQSNIKSSIDAWVKALDLTEEDRCLNIMPIWHGALISNVMTSHAVGATVINVPSPSPQELWAFVDEFRPTWLPLPVDLAEQILGDERVFYYHPGLRFVRLSKASFRSVELSSLEHIFNCPALQSYGMTEAASGPVTCETLKCRRPGSVGKPIHLEVEIDKNQQVLIRGQSVMHGYVAGPSDSFLPSGWLQTRDLGYFDSEGFLYLTGRMG